MFTIREVVQPETLQEAYDILIKRRNNVILGGGSFLRMGHQPIGTAIDLSKLELQCICEENGSIEIGAMATLRDLEINPLTGHSFSGILSQAVRNIIGVQFRNVATVGASVFSRYGFSDIITALMALETSVELFKGGRMPLAEFLAKPFQRDILTKVIIKKDDRTAAYQSLRNSASDFPVLNASVSRLGDTWKVAVGARPNVAAIAVRASEALTKTGITAEEAAELAAEELSFGANMRGSREYRKAMCQVLVKRAIMEVLSCR